MPPSPSPSPQLSVRRGALRSVAFVVAIAAACAPATAGAQGGTIRGTVTDSLGGALGYSVVSVDGDERRLLTDDGGRFLLTGLAPGSYHLRARHLGFLPLDTVATVSAEGSPQLDLRLTRITVRLTEMRVIARGPCLRPGPPDPGTDESLAIIFGQLRENADRAVALATQFPFVFRMERRVMLQMADGDTRPAGVDTIVIDGGVAWRYRRGQVITTVNEYGKAARQVNIPGLVQLSDSAFHNAHCFTYGGVEKIKRKPYIRVDFEPDRLIETPDLEGSVYLDPDSYQISRLVMSVTNPQKLDPQIDAVKVTSLFREIVSSIAILDSAEGVTSFEVTNSHSTKARTERQKTVNVVFTRATPPGASLH